MKVLFAHDNRFYQKGDKIYSIGHFSYDMLWTRYLNFFDEIVVAGRIFKVGKDFNSKGYSVSSGPRVSFIEMDNLMSFSGLLKVRGCLKKMEQAVSAVNCVIARLPSTLGYIACHTALKLKKPLLVEVVGCAWDGFINYGTLLGKIVAPIMFLLNRHYVRKAPYALYVSNEFLQNRYPCKGVTVSCSDVVLKKVDETVLAKRIEKINDGFLGRPIIFGLVGSLDVAYKGHETAFRALALLKDEVDFRLRLLGGGDKTRWIKLAEALGIDEKIEFCGTIPGGEPVFEWLDNLDIILIPSLTEGLPRALIEAMSRGCPAIGSAAGGIVELIDREVLHNPRDYKQLAELIRKIIFNKEKMILLAKRNFDTAKNYEIDKLNAIRNEFFNSYKDFALKNGKK